MRMFRRVMALMTAVLCWCVSLWTSVAADRVVIFSPDAPRPLAPYSHAIKSGHTIYLSGQLGLDPVTNTMVAGGVEKEAEQALINMGAVLRAAGANYTDVVKVTAIFANLADFGVVNEVYKRFFPTDPPARTGFGAPLPAGALIELEAIAVLPSSPNTAPTFLVGPSLVLLLAVASMLVYMTLD